MNAKLSYISLVLMLITVSLLKAQSSEPTEKIYKVDTITNRISEALDFDRNFYLAKDFPFKIQPISVSYKSYRNDRNRDKGKLKKVDTFVVTKKDKKNYTLLIRMPPLGPGKKHVISIDRYLETSDVDKIIESTVVPNLSNETQLKSGLLEVTDQKGFIGYDKEDKKIQDAVGEGLDALIIKIKAAIKNKAAKEKAFEDAFKSFSMATTSNTSAIAAVMYSCEPCKGDTTLLFMGERVSHKLWDILSLLGKIDILLDDTNHTVWKHILKGNMKITDLTREACQMPSTVVSRFKKPALDEIIANLQSTAALLTGLSEFNLSLAKSSVASTSAPQAMIDSLLYQCYNSIGLVQAIIDARQQIRDVITNAEYNEVLDNKEVKLSRIFIMQLAIDGGGTFVSNFETRNALQLTPEFGLVYYGINNFNPKFSGVMPYVGFHINFRYIHRDIPFKIAPYRNSLGARASILVAFSLASIEKENERKDFFNKTSLLLGGGFRLGNAVRLVGGAMIFQHDDSNPLITQYTFVATPFAGVSLDLSLYDLMKGINGIVSALK